MSKRNQIRKRERYNIRKFGHPEGANPPCWCGAQNPYFHIPRGGCCGTGYIACDCGGDLCVCHNHGEVECYGCADCNRDEDHDDYEDFDDGYTDLYHKPAQH